MKKIVFVFAAMLAIAASCTKEETQVSNNEYDGLAPVFTASVATKAELSGTKVNWVAGDHIAVWNGTAAADYSTTGSGATADFTTTDDSFASAANYVALYPYDGSAVFTSGSIATTLPDAQTATAAGFDPAANIAYATSSSTTLSFKNAVAYLQFTVPTGMTDLTSVAFKGNASEKVAGACTVNTSTSALAATGSETATLSGSFSAGSTYYLAVAPQEYASGYTVTITRSSRTYDMVSTKDVTFARSEARNIGELWDGSYEVTGTAIAATTAATQTVGPRTNSNAALKEYTYSYSGSLSAGTVNIKKTYSSTVSGTATVPAGWYHLLYNETTDTFKIYDQELSVNFGSSIDGVNCINAYAENSNMTLYDYNIAEASSVVVTVGSGFTGLYSNGSYTANTSWEFWLDDYDFAPAILYSNLEIKDTDTPGTITISGLNPSSKYDLRISGARGGGGRDARQTKITIGGVDKTYNQGLDGTDSKPATAVNFRTYNVAVYENLSPNGSGEIEITVTAIQKTVKQAHVGCIFISRVVE